MFKINQSIVHIGGGQWRNTDDERKAGPQKDDVVTVAGFHPLDPTYLKLKEYPGPRAYQQDHFRPLDSSDMSHMGIEDALKELEHSQSIIGNDPTNTLPF